MPTKLELAVYGILCATPEELDALRARLQLALEPERHGPTQVFRGEHDGQELVLALSGMGKVNAAAAATVLMSLFSPKALIFSGVAGGLDPELPVGSVLFADRLAIHDYGLVSGGAFTPVAYGTIPIGAPRLSTLPPVEPEVAVNFAALVEAVAHRLETPVRLGGVVTGDYFLNCGATRQQLRADFGADAIDMESGAVSQVARAWGAPLYVIRTLSDLAGEESHLTYPQMAAMAAHNSALCVDELLRLLVAA
ncbi:5'-methylthioadenosine/S-adenosylhomocysteine nucleosidase [Phenylobacterium sp. LjRoot225]|uniref:5'-methylthioadenosine/S-adenosylhomocysteine nucleosidase n=1 Tax=Phenylobacterium sp. LjRoot225 TaxID=3342285 RepID=UPI003ED0ACD6